MSGFGYMGDYRSGFDPGGGTEGRCDAGVLWAKGGVGDGEGGVKRGQERVRFCSGGCFVGWRLLAMTKIRCHLKGAIPLGLPHRAEALFAVIGASSRCRAPRNDEGTLER